VQISPAGIALIESNEGFSSAPYNDNGKTAWGFGHDQLPQEAVPASVTREQAEATLISDLTFVQNALTELVPSSCTQNQWDALCDFGYNLGVASLKTMLAHGWDQVPEQIGRWCHVNGAVSQGLTVRRNAEITLFNA
jgi:GH24 family phage-related lysozyme (muramidase)